jgi:hypothetical protein
MEVMAVQTGNRRANALKHEWVVRVEEPCRATAGTVYELLADLRSHAIWAGERQRRNTRLLSVEAPESPAVVGTEFHTTGADPMGSFSDRSVVTEATPGRVLEFVTEAHLQTKKGKSVDWTNVHRYELSPERDGCRITYTIRVTRISELVGMLAAFRIPGLRRLTSKASGAVARRGVRNLARMAEERDRGLVAAEREES